MFSSETNGYNKKQVDKKINELLSEMSSLNKVLQEKNKLNLGLANALKKEKEIEASAKNLYDLKIKKILILYKNLEKSFNNLFTLYPQIEELDDIKKSFDQFHYVVETSFTTKNSAHNINSTVNTENDTIRLLLSKMSTYSKMPPISQTNNQSVSIKRKDSVALKKKTSTQKFDSKPKTTQTILKKYNFVNDDKFDSPADRFLESGETENNAYTKILNSKHPDDLYPTPNESGFDLKEAVNPKDDLDAIMSSFDFFNEDKK